MKKQFQKVAAIMTTVSPLLKAEQTGIVFLECLDETEMLKWSARLFQLGFCLVPRQRHCV